MADSNPNPTTIPDPNPNPNSNPNPTTVIPQFTNPYHPQPHPHPNPHPHPPGVNVMMQPPPPHFPAHPIMYPGVIRYPSPYAPMLRPPYPPRPLGVVMPPIARPPILVRGPIMPPVRPPVATNITIQEKPQTTVYVGKISSTVENEFMLSLLQLCGPVKSWKRPQDPAGTLKGFGFCEFESAEGVLRALRLLNKLSVDGQELMLNVNQTTRQYLERFVEKKLESSKVSTTEGIDKEETSTNTNETTVKSSEESSKPSLDGQKKDGNETPNKENTDTTNMGLVTDEDRETDREAVVKLTGMLEERLKSHPLPPPPPPPLRPVDGSLKSNSEQQSESRDKESDAEEKTEYEKTAESKPSERNESSLPDRSKRQDRPKDRDRETKREKERELERYEREREQDRAKREKEREYKSREDERRYKVREKDWEVRERERDHWRKKEREREKERAHERKWEVIDQERDSEDGHGKKRKHKASEEERKRRLREKEEDFADRLREEEEIAEAKLRADEEKEKSLQEAMSIISSQTVKEHQKADLQYDMFEDQDNDVDHKPNQDTAVDQTVDHKPSCGINEGQVVVHNGVNVESVTSPSAASDTKQTTNAQSRKLGFGLSLSGKRASVPSVFKEDEDEEAHKDKKMRPLVPIDYSTEDQQTIQPSTPEGPSANVAAASEFLKRISTREEKPDVEKEKGRRSHERSGHRDRSRHAEDHNSNREESRKDGYDRERANKSKTPENQKLLDAKQLIDTIPKTKDELFSYEIKWAIYDQNALHEKMRPWISKKITEYLGEEEVTLVDYIVSSTQEHVDASEMLERLQTILDDEAEMFVLKMWRMLIFEIKRVENGLAPKLRT